MIPLPLPAAPRAGRAGPNHEHIRALERHYARGWLPASDARDQLFVGRPEPGD